MRNLAALTIEAKVGAGDSIFSVVREATRAAAILRMNVHFTFNDIGLTMCPDESEDDVLKMYDRWRQERRERKNG